MKVLKVLAFCLLISSASYACVTVDMQQDTYTVDPSGFYASK